MASSAAEAATDGMHSCSEGEDTPIAAAAQKTPDRRRSNTADELPDFVADACQRFQRAPTPERQKLCDALDITDGGPEEYIKGLWAQLKASREEIQRLRQANAVLRSSTAKNKAPDTADGLRATIERRQSEAVAVAATLRECERKAAGDDARRQCNELDEAWRDVEEQRERIIALVAEGEEAGLYPRDHIALTWGDSLNYLLGGKKVMTETASVTANLVRECATLTTRVQDEHDAIERQIRPFTAQIHTMAEALVQRRKRLNELPKGQARGRETEAILDLYVEQLRTFEASTKVLREQVARIDRIGGAADGMGSGAALRNATCQRLSALRKRSTTHFKNLEVFSNHMMEFSEAHANAERQKFTSYVVNIHQQMGDTFAALCRRHSEYVAAREKILAARRDRLAEVRRTFEVMDEYDPRGEETAAEIARLEREVSDLGTGLERVRGVRVEAQSICSSFSETLKQLPLPDGALQVPSTPPHGGKRKRDGDGDDVSTPNGAKRTAGGDDRPSARTPSQSPGARHWFFGLI